MLELYPLLKQLWLVWFMLLFTGIVIWAWWPSRKRTFEDYARIPLRDEGSPPSGQR